MFPGLSFFPKHQLLQTLANKDLGEFLYQSTLTPSPEQQEPH